MMRIIAYNNIVSSACFFMKINSKQHIKNANNNNNNNNLTFVSTFVSLKRPIEFCIALQ